MTEITDVRCVLLSAPYANADDLEVRTHLPSGRRTCGLVELTLSDGTTGLGEGYLAVFAPETFAAIVDRVAEVLLGEPIADIGARVDDLRRATGYWSRRGAARHVLSAFEIAMHDARARQLDVPAYELLGGKRTEAIRLYGSGGDVAHPEAMDEEFDRLEGHGIDAYKIRARGDEPNKATWALEHGADRGVEVAIDMAQSLAIPGQRLPEAVRFVRDVQDRSGEQIAFLEEPFAPFNADSYRTFRRKVDVPTSGGETLTTPAELIGQLEAGQYDIVQPDATVIGGMGAVTEVFDAAGRAAVETVVHCWGGPASVKANYHAAFAGGGRLAEWPMKNFPLCEAMYVEEPRIEDGRLKPPTAPGLGIELTDDVEDRFAYDPEAVYDPVGRDVAVDDTVWY